MAYVSRVNGVNARVEELLRETIDTNSMRVKDGWLELYTKEYPNYWVRMNLWEVEYFYTGGDLDSDFIGAGVYNKPKFQPFWEKCLDLFNSVEKPNE